MSTSISVKLVLDTDGNIDEAQSLVAFETQLSAYKAERELEESTIADAVHAVFDQYRGANIQMPALVGSALRSLNVQPSNWTAMEKKVHAFVSSNSDRLANAKKGVEAEPERTRSFGIRKGQGGGVCRWSDVPEAAPESK